MGYTTEFYGGIELDKPLKPEHAEYLLAFAESRRMKRDATIVATFRDPVRERAKLPVGLDGGYFVGSVNEEFIEEHVGDGENKAWCCAGQVKDPSILNYNSPPEDQPGLWCQWVPCVEPGPFYHDGFDSQAEYTFIAWDGNEKFYGYEDWMLYLLRHFLVPWGYIANGEIEWQGEDRDDMGLIVVENNVMSIKRGTITYE